MSAKRQKRIHAAQRSGNLFDRLVGARKAERLNCTASEICEAGQARGLRSTTQSPPLF